MNDQQQAEAIKLLHKARELFHGYQADAEIPHIEMLDFLANSEEFLAESLGEKVHYRNGKSSRGRTITTWNLIEKDGDQTMEIQFSDGSIEFTTDEDRKAEAIAEWRRHQP